MNEDFFLYFEELDWAVRGGRSGFDCLYSPRSIVFHKVGASTDRKKHGRLTATVKFAYLNRLKFTVMNFEGQMKRVRLRIFLEGGRELLMGNREEGMYAIRLAMASRNKLMSMNLRS